MMQNGEVVVATGNRSCCTYEVRSSCERRFKVERDAELVLQLLCSGAEDLACKVSIELAENSRVTFVSVDMSDASTDLSYAVALNGSAASFDFKGVYIAASQEHKNVSLNVMHNVADCRSGEMMKGIAASHGEGRFHGRIYVAKDAQRTEAYQQSRNLLLNTEARIFTEPQLEIYADDVKCSHGAVVGQVEDEAVYYMRQRGIDEAEARKLLTEGFANEIVWHAEGVDVQSCLREAIERKLNSI